MFSFPLSHFSITDLRFIKNQEIKRPIISGVNSITCNLSHYVDLYLQDHVKVLDSYLRDSDNLNSTFSPLVRKHFSLDNGRNITVHKYKP